VARNDVNIVVKARDEASRKFSKIGKSAGGMGSMFKKAAAAAAVYFGARAIKRFTTESLELYGIQETAVNNLTAALGNLGAAGQINEMKSFASDMQKITTAGDEATLGVMALGASMGNLSGDELKDATKASMGLAKAYNMDAVAAMRLVARARMGDTASLSRYGIKLDAALSSQEKFNKVLEIGAKNFKLVTAETNTFSGKVQQMKNALGDVKEEIGGALMPMFLTSAEKIKCWAEDNQKRIGDWAKKTVAAVTLGKDVFFSFAGYMKDDWTSATSFVFDSFLTLLKAAMESAAHLAIAGGRGIGKSLKKGLKGGIAGEANRKAIERAEANGQQFVSQSAAYRDIPSHVKDADRSKWVNEHWENINLGMDLINPVDKYIWKGSTSEGKENYDDFKKIQAEELTKAQKRQVDSILGGTLDAVGATFKNAREKIANDMPKNLGVNVAADFEKFQNRLAAINNPAQAPADNKNILTARNQVAANSLAVLKEIAVNTKPRLAARESRFMTYDNSAKTPQADKDAADRKAIADGRWLDKAAENWLVGSGNNPADVTAKGDDIKAIRQRVNARGRNMTAENNERNNPAAGNLKPLKAVLEQINNGVQQLNRQFRSGGMSNPMVIKTL